MLDTQQRHTPHTYLPHPGASEERLGEDPSFCPPLQDVTGSKIGSLHVVRLIKEIGGY
jgi:hypothetical protein